MKYFFAAVFFLMATGFAEHNEAYPFEVKKTQPSPVKIFFMPYFKLNLVLPGVGCSVRGQKAHFGLQLDANTTLAPGIGAGIREATLSALFFPGAKKNGEWSYGGWNLGIGAGIGEWVSDTGGGVLPVFPFFAGYQGKKHFFNIALHPLDRAEPWMKWIPSMKYGWCF